MQKLKRYFPYPRFPSPPLSLPCLTPTAQASRERNVFTPAVCLLCTQKRFKTAMSSNDTSCKLHPISEILTVTFWFLYSLWWIINFSRPLPLYSVADNWPSRSLSTIYSIYEKRNEKEIINWTIGMPLCVTSCLLLLGDEHPYSHNLFPLLYSNSVRRNSYLIQQGTNGFNEILELTEILNNK